MTASQYLTGLATCGEQVSASTSVDDAITMNDAMARCLADLHQVRLCGGVVHLVGNGGSAAIVAHAQNDFMKAAGVKALVHQDVPTLTAYANDEGYEHSVSRPLAAWLHSQDVVIAVSSSGMSDNILDAVNVAKSRGARVITCSGREPTNALRTLGHVNFYVPSMQYGYVELTHAALLHYLTDELAHA